MTRYFNQKFTRYFWLLTILAVLVGGCKRDTGKDPGEKPKVESVKSQNDHFTFRLKWVIYSSFASHFVALEKGYFRDEGLDVEIRGGGPGLDPIRLVASGTDDVGLATYDQVLIAREKGIPIVAIGEDYIRSGVGFFSLANSGITTPKNFEGKRVGILPGTDKHTVYLALLEAESVKRSSITEVPVGADLNVLLNGTVDVYPGFITNQPFVAEERGAPVNIIDPFVYGVRPGGNVYFVTEDVLRTRKDELTRFLRAVIRGIIVSQRMASDDVVDIVLKHNDRLDRAAELKIWNATKDVLLEKDSSRVGYMDDTKWTYTATISEKYGLLEKAPTISDCYTNKLVESIHSKGLPPSEP